MIERSVQEWVKFAYDKGSIQVGECCDSHIRERVVFSLMHELADLRRKLEISEAALARLEEAADYFAADQSRATDPRCGLVQPVSVAECEELNQAIMQARSALSAIRAGKRGEA